MELFVNNWVTVCERRQETKETTRPVLELTGSGLLFITRKKKPQHSGEFRCFTLFPEAQRHHFRHMV